MFFGKISTFKATVLAVLLLTLGACQAMPESTQSAPATASQEKPPSGGGEGDLQSIEAALQALEARQKAALPKEPPIDDRPERFLGLDRGGLQSELGEPQLLRKETPAEVWQYRADDCILDFFLYPEAGEFRVLHLESRDRKAGSVEASPCLRRLIEIKRADSLS